MIIPFLYMFVQKPLLYFLCKNVVFRYNEIRFQTLCMLHFFSVTATLYILVGLIVLLALWVMMLEMRVKKLLVGKDAKSLEDSFVNMKKDLEDYAQFKKDSIEYLKNIEARLKRSLQSVETVRFNPFKGTGSGGNQSFATAFINEKGDGVVISSLYSREHVSVFSKPLKKFESEFEMSEEERNVITKAQENLNSHK